MAKSWFLSKSAQNEGFETAMAPVVSKALSHLSGRLKFNIKIPIESCYKDVLIFEEKQALMFL